ncbi:MAG: hypothetical protein V2I33_07280 [Kangiellaceae bacterium]|jgi:hypothetical protein|nr:hypothetical protein [Kangiellaceae bacterium]
MKLLAFVIALTSVGIYSKGLGNVLEKSNDEQLAFILTTSELLYERKDFPIINIIQTWEEVAECGGTYESCPNARLFITSSSGDLYETPHLYELPKSKGWAFVSSQDFEHHFYITIKTTLKHANVSIESRRQWRSQSYTLKVSKYDGMISLIE